MDTYRLKILETADFFKARIKALPVIGLPSGTGLGETAAAIQASLRVAYQDVSHFPVSIVGVIPDICWRAGCRAKRSLPCRVAFTFTRDAG